jgi:hypothetical protein
MRTVRGMIKRPPVPAEWKARFDLTIFNVKGVPHTIADYYREQLFKPALDKRIRDGFRLPDVLVSEY